jgi:hypothetical protein
MPRRSKKKISLTRREGRRMCVTGKGRINARFKDEKMTHCLPPIRVATEQIPSTGSKKMREITVSVRPPP